MTSVTEHTIALEESKYDSVRFSLADFIGRGELGAVYRGTAEPDGVAVAVKIPHTLEKNHEAMLEYDVLRALGQALNEPSQPIGDIGRGQFEGKTVIVMPLYENADRLSEHIRMLLQDDKRIEAEQLALKAAVHYTQVMAALHAIEPPWSCTDRKSKDFYFSNRRFYILDWNVLRPNEERYRVTEINQFGHLWHELFLGSKGSAPFDPFDDRKWADNRSLDGLLSVGLRVLMARAVDFSAAPDADGKQLKQLGSALFAWRQILEGTEPPSSQRISAILAAFSNNDDQPNEKYVDAILYDIRWRLGIDDTDEKRIQAMAAARESQYGSDMLLREIVDRIEYENAENIQTYLDVGMKSASAEKIALGRWHYLLGILQQASSRLIGGEIRSYQYENVKQAVIQIGSLLHPAPKFDDQARLSDVAARLSRLKDIDETWDNSSIDILEEECRLRKSAVDFSNDEKWSLARRLAFIDELTRAFDRCKGSYLQPEGDTDKSLLTALSGDHLLPRLRRAVQAVDAGENDAVQHFYADYHQLLALADLQGEGRWLSDAVRPWLDVVEFHMAYGAGGSTKDRTIDLLRALERLEDHHDEFEGIRRVAGTYLRRLANDLSGRLAGPVTWNTWTQISEIYNLLDERRELLNGYGFSLLEPATVEKHSRLKTYFGRWHAVLSQLSAETDSAARNAILRTLIAVIKDKPEEIEMTSLLGAEALEKYRTELEQLLNSEIEGKIERLKGEIDETINVLNGDFLSLESAKKRLFRKIHNDIGEARAQAETELNLLGDYFQISQKELAQLVAKIQGARREHTDGGESLLSAIAAFRSDFKAAQERIDHTIDAFREGELAKIKDKLDALEATMKKTFMQRLGRHKDYLRQWKSTLAASSDEEQRIDMLLDLTERHVTLMRDALPSLEYNPESHAEWLQTMDEIVKAFEEASNPASPQRGASRWSKDLGEMATEFSRLVLEATNEATKKLAVVNSYERPLGEQSHG